MKEKKKDGRNIYYRCSMKQKIPRLPKDEGQLQVVVGHHLGLEHLLAQGHKVVNVLNRLNSNHYKYNITNI